MAGAHGRPCHVDNLDCEGLTDGKHAFPYMLNSPYYAVCYKERFLAKATCPKDDLGRFMTFDETTGSCSPQDDNWNLKPDISHVFNSSNKNFTGERVSLYLNVSWTATWENVPVDVCAKQNSNQSVHLRSLISPRCSNEGYAFLAIKNALSDDSDQTVWMSRLLCIFTGRTCQNTLHII